MLKRLRPKVTDTFGRVHNYLRVSLTERCNLRCQYCMPDQGIDLTPKPQLLTTPEILRLIDVFAGMGTTKVRFTGGEPLVHPEIVDICRATSSIPGITKVCLTTNGIKLPRMIGDLKAAGVTGFNVSLDTMDADKFLLITRRNGLGKVLDSIKVAEHMGYDPVKINCVAMRGVNENELADFARLTKDRALEVRFIEFMPFDDNRWSRNKMLPFMEMMDIIERGCGEKLQFDATGETAKLFRLPGHRGTVGFITSMTTNFCGTCNRMRLTADGNLKVCLFGEDETSLRDPMRAGATDGDLEAIIRAAVNKKHFSHGGKASPEEIAATMNRPMIKIGG
jgi:cyclic pyranopterin phosphate synthase